VALIDCTMQHPFRHFFSRSPRTIHGIYANSRRRAFRPMTPKRKTPPLYATRGEAPATSYLLVSAGAEEITLPDEPCSAPQGTPSGDSQLDFRQHVFPHPPGAVGPVARNEAGADLCAKLWIPSSEERAAMQRAGYRRTYFRVADSYLGAPD
jgi:hypothetical protein